MVLGERKTEAMTETKLPILKFRLPHSIWALFIYMEAQSRSQHVNTCRIARVSCIFESCGHPPHLCNYYNSLFLWIVEALGLWMRNKLRNKLSVIVLVSKRRRFEVSHLLESLTNLSIYKNSCDRKACFILRLVSWEDRLLV